MSLGVAIPAMAATTEPTALVPVEVGITKELTMPWGTTTPDATFVFTFTQLDANANDSDPTVTSAAPLVPPTVTIPNMTVIYEAGTGPNRMADYPGPGATPPFFSDVQVAHRTSPTSITNALDGVVWPSTGLFSFLIREVTPPDSTNSFIDDEEFMTYDESVFVLTVRVGLCPVTGELVPVQAYAWPGTEGTDGRIVWDGKLYRIYPGIPGEPGGTWERQPSDIRFVNNFYRDIGELEEEDEVPSFLVRKNVRQGVADSDVFADLDLYFGFNVTLNVPAPALAPMSDDPFAADGAAITVTGYIFNEDGTPAMTTGASPVQRTVTFTGTPVRVYNTATPPVWISSTLQLTSATPFELRHGQTMEIPVLPAGTQFTVQELQDANYYLADVEVLIGGQVATLSPTPPTGTGTVGQNVTIPAGSQILYIVDTRDEDGSLAGNEATFLNAYRYVPFTGLVVASMPVLIALIVATLMLAMMVASRSRKRIEQMPFAV